MLAWICREHEPACSWQAAISARTHVVKAESTACPQCVASRLPKQRIIRQPTIAAAEPPLDVLAQQWHPDNDRSSEQVTLGSDYSAKWHCLNASCQHPHVWHARVSMRARDRTRCPFCSGLYVPVIRCWPKHQNWQHSGTMKPMQILARQIRLLLKATSGLDDSI